MSSNRSPSSSSSLSLLRAGSSSIRERGTRAERFPYSTSHSSSDAQREAETTHTMATDEDYAAFLEKANADPSEGISATQSVGRAGLKAVDEGEAIPAVLKSAVADAFYVSDADEPFEPVCLNLPEDKGTLPDEGAFFCPVCLLLKH